ncbi:three-Cys-motif partner protein TcmP [Rhizobium leguminosarum]|uniref:three-Cys-motif partner protein TcmP n=1 Tax=Rhizobium leguminosarum TaxID=384 RepID=UPI0010386BAD|nr:three-Cys-motif partner protein TcmP [Rhizobium leguminosarum]TBZ28945.1 three-Cys-motif partner protein TcmP [Rhizobium leguminosarum bv. viciae]TCA03169.1 three-Cys-motif partner protein TcmP [Rhizobium leguminosarum bv. viciae]TCA14533.1 three-Cys-motif partner protein TcmP [Rhizobium leguminosarum bv. viciae]
MDQRHFFGSSETEKKLDCLRQYLTAYSTALKNKNFARIYIDAFAGTGSRTETKAVLPFMGEGEESLVEVTTPGSARIALETKPGFHYVLLIEKDPGRVAALKNVLDEYPGARGQVREGDANAIVQRVCNRYDWHRDRQRGVVFLDPYGMEVYWETVEAIAKTEALDCWYFFPLSGLYRNAPKDPERLDAGKVAILNRVFGTTLWRDEWYEQESRQFDIFGDLVVEERRTFDVNRIENWVGDRLRSVFKGGVLKPVRLHHSNGAPMASLFFAIANPNKAAVRLATEIAGHILNRGI